jgi:hypothetical protein
VKADRLYRRLEALEAKAKPVMISTWVDFVLWLDEHEDDEGDVEVELCPELQVLVEMMTGDSRPGGLSFLQLHQEPR